MAMQHATAIAAMGIKGRLLRGGGFGWRDHQAERDRDGQPTADVRHEHPAHGTVIGNRQRARLRRAARGVLEERERIQVNEDLVEERQPRALLF